MYSLYRNQNQESYQNINIFGTINWNADLYKVNLSEAEEMLATAENFNSQKHICKKEWKCSGKSGGKVHWNCKKMMTWNLRRCEEIMHLDQGVALPVVTVKNMLIYS